jgi:hypothetical protein
MLVSPWPSCSSTTSGSRRAGEPLNFTPLHPAGCWVDPEGHRRSNPILRAPDRRKKRPLSSRSFHRPLRGQVQNRCEMPMLCRRPAGSAQPNSNCRAEIPGAEQVLRARFFCLKPGLASWSLHGPIPQPRLGPPGASTSPESGSAVSTSAKFLSREKRKMWLTFSYCVYL